ncbi:MAG: hypothetical protein JXR56_00945 [Candidatus Cloacimonetes bacterium]|nr:hypothetical protein [Candidatus Cloacimonadota bacterium]
MNWYITAVKAHPIYMAMIQFAILGTLGEFISKWISAKKFFFPFTPLITIWKMIEWAFLAVLIKAVFVGYSEGLIPGLQNHVPAFLPQAEKGTFLFAFMVSTLMNLQFGMTLVIGHRVLDNLPLKVKNWKGLDKGLLCLIWFWIPAHTITFMLPKDYQIGLAALWSVALGLLLGLFNRK